MTDNHAEHSTWSLVVQGALYLASLRWNLAAGGGPCGSRDLYRAETMLLDSATGLDPEQCCPIQFAVRALARTTDTLTGLAVELNTPTAWEESFDADQEAVAAILSLVDLHETHHGTGGNTHP